jgi:dipeptidyl aminopeptidase/acylaminoacyl peptidase
MDFILKKRLSKCCAPLLMAALLLNACAMNEKEQTVAPVNTLEKFTPETLLSLGRISSPAVSPDGKTLLFSVAYPNVKENTSLSSFYVTDLEGKACNILLQEKKSVSNPCFYDGGKKLLFLQGGQLYSVNLKGEGAQMSASRKKLIASHIQYKGGESAISAFTLSPDEKKLLLVGTVKGPTDRPSDRYADLDKADAYVADDMMYRHWDHWKTELPHSFVASFDGKSLGEAVDILGEEGRAYELPVEPFFGIEQLCWSPDSEKLAYSVKRKSGKDFAFSTNTDIYIYDLLNNQSYAVTHDGGYDTDPVWSPDGQYLAWLSMERDGYEADRARIMVRSVASVPAPLSLDGGVDISVPEGENVELTRGFDRDASELKWTADSKEIRFSSLTDGIRAVFSVDLQGNICRLTSPEDACDYNTPFYEADGKAYLIRQSLNRPKELCVLSYADASVQAVSHVNDAIFDALTDPRVEERWIETVDGKKMLTWVMYPPQFDPAKTYPAILITLGGPQGTISQSWSYRWCYRLMAEQGYVVVLPNRRGTTAFGQEWKEQISGDYPGMNMQDYLSAAKALKSEPYIDKIAACGASYGGYSVYYLSGIHQGVFDCFIAHAGIFNEEHMYQTTEEMWFPEWDNGGGYPSKDVVGEARSEKAREAYSTQGPSTGSPWSKNPKAQRHYRLSPHKLVENWDTPLLVIHGGRDYRVPFDQGLAAFNCAQMMGVPSRLLLFPEENHWILSPQNALLWHREYFKWLDQWCK